MSDLNALTKLLRTLISWRVDADVSKGFAMRDNLRSLLAIATEGPDGQPELADIFKTYATVPDLPPTADLWEIVFVSGVGTLYYWNGLMWNPLTSGGGPITAGQVLTTTATFHYILSALDTNVQLALETIDQMMAANLRTDTTNFDHNLGPTDTDVQTALETIDDMTFAGLAADVPVDTTNFDNNLGPGDTNVQIALETIDDLAIPADASEVPVDASGFAGNLSPTDTDVQTALGTIDGLAIPADASEVSVDASGFSGNLSPTDTDVQTALGTIDGLVIPPGDVVGPASAVDKGIVTFNSTTGKLVQDSGSRLYGASATDPVPPPAPSDGDMYYNTTLKKLMIYDSSRLKWLSSETFNLHCCHGNGTGANVYFQIGNVTMDAIHGGYAIPNNCTLVHFSYTRDDNDAASFVVERNGVTTIYTLNSSAFIGYDMAVNADLNVGDFLTVKNGGVNAMTTPLVHMELKWRV